MNKFWTPPGDQPKIVRRYSGLKNSQCSLQSVHDPTFQQSGLVSLSKLFVLRKKFLFILAEPLLTLSINETQIVFLQRTTIVAIQWSGDSRTLSGGFENIHNALSTDVRSSRQCFVTYLFSHRQWLEIQRLRNKVKRKVDTKASKGRRLR